MSESASELTINETIVLSNSVRSRTGITRAGGISHSGGSVGIVNSTIKANETLADVAADGVRGGIIRSVTTEISNSIMAGNMDSSGLAPNCGGGPISSLGYNILGDNTGCDFMVAEGGQIGDVAGGMPIDPLRGSLEDNGGGFIVGDFFVPVLTHALLDGSPEIDAGSPVEPGSGPGSCTEEDQRGEFRPMDGDDDGTAICDIGEFEVMGNAIPGVGGSGGSGCFVASTGSAITFSVYYLIPLLICIRKLIRKVQ